MHIYNIFGTAKPTAPTAHDQHKREFGNGRPADRAHWQDTNMARRDICGMVRPVTLKRTNLP